MVMMERYPVCNDKVECFARLGTDCTILSDTYPDGKCPFRKESRGNDGVQMHNDFKVGKPHCNKGEKT